MKGAAIARPPAYRITVAQCLALLLIWAALAGWDTLTAKSFMLGGLVAIIPNAWFAMGVFRWRGAAAAQRAVKAGYLAETGKFLLSVAGFAVIFALIRPIEGWAVFAGYGAMLIGQIIGAWWLLRVSANQGR
jgi:ATP synthase protein I